MNYAAIPIEKLAKYNATDCIVTEKLHDLFYPKVTKNFDFLYTEIIQRALRLLIDIRKNGQKINIDVAKKIQNEYNQKINEIVDDLHKYAPVRNTANMFGQEKALPLFADFFVTKSGIMNFNSADDLKHLFYKEMGLKPVKTLENGNGSTDKEAINLLLENLSGEQGEILEKILLYKKYSKTVQMYSYEKVKNWLDVNGFSHFNLKLHTTETGRTSGDGMQFGKDSIERELIISRFPDGKIVKADFSQIEVRVLAEETQDESLLEAFNSGIDIHQRTACKILDLSEDDFSKLDKSEKSMYRQAAKSVNFGLIYGQTKIGLARTLTKTFKRIVSPDEAETYIDKFFSKSRKIKDWMTNQIKFAEKNGYVISKLGRMRRLPEIQNVWNVGKYERAKRQAINAIIQGTASDLLLFCASHVNETFDKYKMQSKVILTVHDEIDIDAHPAEVNNVFEIVREIMNNKHPIKFSVPIVCEIEFGDNWRHLVKVA